MAPKQNQIKKKNLSQPWSIFSGKIKAYKHLNGIPSLNEIRWYQDLPLFVLDCGD